MMCYSDCKGSDTGPTEYSFEVENKGKDLDRWMKFLRRLGVKFNELPEDCDSIDITEFPDWKKLPPFKRQKKWYDIFLPTWRIRQLNKKQQDIYFAVKRELIEEHEAKKKQLEAKQGLLDSQLDSNLAPLDLFRLCFEEIGRCSYSIGREDMEYNEWPNHIAHQAALKDSRKFKQKFRVSQILPFGEELKGKTEITV